MAWDFSKVWSLNINLHGMMLWLWWGISDYTTWIIGNLCYQIWTMLGRLRSILTLGLCLEFFSCGSAGNELSQSFVFLFSFISCSTFRTVSAHGGWWATKSRKGETSLRVFVVTSAQPHSRTRSAIQWDSKRITGDCNLQRLHCDIIAQIFHSNIIAQSFHYWSIWLIPI